MTEEDYHEISSLLKRRNSQREYLQHQRENIAACQEAAAAHAEEIRDLQRRLLKLGYKGQ